MGPPSGPRPNGPDAPPRVSLVVSTYILFIDILKIILIVFSEYSRASFIWYAISRGYEDQNTTGLSSNKGKQTNCQPNNFHGSGCKCRCKRHNL